MTGTKSVKDLIYLLRLLRNALAGKGHIGYRRRTVLPDRYCIAEGRLLWTAIASLRDCSAGPLLHR